MSFGLTGMGVSFLGYMCWEFHISPQWHHRDAFLHNILVLTFVIGILFVLFGG
jgi:hypothetical protein